MMRPNSLPRLRRALALSLVLVAACGRSPVEPERYDPVGTISFTYSGARSGSYQVTGELQLGSAEAPRPAPGAAAFTRDSVLAIVGWRSDGGTRGDYFTLLLGVVAAEGSVQLDPVACAQQAFDRCRVGVFAPDIDPAALPGGAADLPALAGAAYVMALGAVNVTARSDLRVRGTFQGIAFRGNEQSIQNMITINGQFDVPVRPE
jgi:hypothetical protein